MSSKRENRYKERAYLEILTSAHAQTSGAIYNEVFGVTNDFFTPVIVKYMEKNPVIANRFCRSLGPSLRYRI